MKRYTLNQIKELMNKDKNHNVIAIVSIKNDSSDYYLIKKIKYNAFIKCYHKQMISYLDSLPNTYHNLFIPLYDYKSLSEYTV